jgi:hypothetical protein
LVDIPPVAASSGHELRIWGDQLKRLALLGYVVLVVGVAAFVSVNGHRNSEANKQRMGALAGS